MIRPRFFLVFCLILLLTGCLGVPSAIHLSPKEQAQMAAEVQLARKSFRQGDYSAAEKRLVPLSEKASVDQPLYQYELASAYLLDGKKEQAHQALLAAHHSIEGFFDADSEQKAASLWGKEADKVFKGEPYERATLYFLLALSFLEHNNPDNALAALKTGLLADSDTEDNSYKSDFGLLQLLAAKCYDLRGEPELRDQMLAAAFTSATSVAATSKLYALKLVEKYTALKQQQTLENPPPPVLAQLCALAPATAIELWLKRNEIPAETATEVAQWAEKSTASIDPLNFNTLVVLWRGSSPQAIRSGQYGELRLISPGDWNPNSHYSIAVDSDTYSSFVGFGDINYQATTRGGREMDNVLGKQASFKGAADTGGNVMIATGAVGTGNSDADLILFAGGILFKALSAATNPEADIRYWHNLPARFDIIPLNLMPGNHTLQLLRTEGETQKRVQEPLHVSIPEEADLNVFHIQVIPEQERRTNSSFNVSGSDVYPEEVDLDGNQEVSDKEKKQIEEEVEKTWEQPSEESPATATEEN